MSVDGSFFLTFSSPYTNWYHLGMIPQMIPQSSWFNVEKRLKPLSHHSHCAGVHSVLLAHHLSTLRIIYHHSRLFLAWYQLGSTFSHNTNTLWAETSRNTKQTSSSNSIPNVHDMKKLPTWKKFFKKLTTCFHFHFSDCGLICLNMAAYSKHRLLGHHRGCRP